MLNRRGRFTGPSTRITCHGSRPKLVRRRSVISGSASASISRRTASPLRRLCNSVRTELHNRRKGDAVRLEIEANADPEITERLRTNFGLEPWQVIRVDGPVNLTRLFNIYEQADRPDLKCKPFVHREVRLTAKSQHLFEELREQDDLVEHL